MKSKHLSENILRSVKSKGFKYIDLPSVIEADHIVQRSGENFRKFIFSFIDQNGNELCLRPDLTIVSCLRYLENNLRGKEKIFYNGQAYRKSQNKKSSIIRNQVGFEILGSKDEKNDDKEIINTSLKALKNLKYTSGTLTIGNVEIFKLLISKLEIPARWKLRLLRHFWRDDYFNDLLSRLETNADIDPTEVAVDKKRYLNLLIIGPSNSGKTIMLDCLIRKYYNLNNDIEIKARIFALKRHTHLSYKILQGLDVLVFLEMKNKVYSLLLYFHYMDYLMGCQSSLLKK